jgi:drug/metabolite transporter (DMT)-like permease
VTTGRRTILTTSLGTHHTAFGLVEWALLGVSAIGFGSAFVLIAEALTTMRPGVITFGRAGLGAVALWLLPGARRPVDREDWPRIMVLSMVWVVVPLALVPIAQQWIDSSVTGMLGGAMPIFATVIAAVMLRRRPRTVQLAGIVVGTGGVALISLPSIDQGVEASLGTLLVLAATGSYALALTIATPLQQRYGAIPIMARILTVGAALTAPYAILQAPGSRVTAGPAAALLVVGLFSTGLAYVTLSILGGRAGSSRSSTVAYLVPVIAAAMGWLVRGERVSAPAAIGMACAVGGAVLASRSDHGPTGPVRPSGARPPRARS